MPKTATRLAQQQINRVIGAYIRRVRGKTTLTQTEFAHALGLDQSAFSRIETGKQQLTAAQWMTFLHLAGVRRFQLSGAIKSALGKLDRMGGVSDEKTKKS